MGWGNTLGYFVGAVVGARGLEPKLGVSICMSYCVKGSHSFDVVDRNVFPLSFFLAAIAGLSKTLQLLYRVSGFR